MGRESFTHRREQQGLGPGWPRLRGLQLLSPRSEVSRSRCPGQPRVRRGTPAPSGCSPVGPDASSRGWRCLIDRSSISLHLLNERTGQKVAGRPLAWPFERVSHGKAWREISPARGRQRALREAGGGCFLLDAAWYSPYFIQGTQATLLYNQKTEFLKIIK